MQINYSEYPPDWKEIRERILKRAENKCEFCGVQNQKLIFNGIAFIDGKILRVYQDSDLRVFDASNSVEVKYSGMVEPLNGNPYQKATRVILTIAHLDHDKSNFEVADDRLKALCQACHLNYDRPRHNENRKFGRNFRKNQGRLFPEK